MIKKSIVYLILLMLVSGCSVKYMALEKEISSAIMPEQIFNTGINIASSDLPDSDKRKLSIKLAKRSLTVFQLYIQYVIDGKKVPNKGEIVGMLKFLSKNIDKFDDSEVAEQFKLLAEKLTFILMASYYDKEIKFD